MPLIKDGAFREDGWERIEGEAPVPPEGDVIVDASRLTENDASLAGRTGRLGVLWPNTLDVNVLKPWLDRLSLVALELPSFTDGRAFSQARVLRHQLGFAGEIRATGNPKADQAAFLLRCGFDAFEVRGTQAPELWQELAGVVTRVYQPGYSPVAGKTRAESAAEARRAAERRKAAAKAAEV